jgi:hypothetical protein
MMSFKWNEAVQVCNVLNSQGPDQALAKMLNEFSDTDIDIVRLLSDSVFCDSHSDIETFYLDFLNFDEDDLEILEEQTYYRDVVTPEGVMLVADETVDCSKIQCIYSELQLSDDGTYNFSAAGFPVDEGLDDHDWFSDSVIESDDSFQLLGLDYLSELMNSEMGSRYVNELVAVGAIKFVSFLASVLGVENRRVPLVYGSFHGSMVVGRC